MKKYLILLLLFISSLAFSQSQPKKLKELTFESNQILYYAKKKLFKVLIQKNNIVIGDSTVIINGKLVGKYVTIGADRRSQSIGIAVVIDRGEKKPAKVEQWLLMTSKDGIIGIIVFREDYEKMYWYEEPKNVKRI